MPPPKTSGKNLESENYEYDFSVIRDYFIPHTIITSPQPCSVFYTPLIEYTLELLAVAGVQEAYLF
ncbi:3670_t:CDS:2, partial [Cetraspora pellucida]